MTNISEERIPGQTIWVGVVAYDPKVVTIWEGMRRYFHEEARLPVEVVLFQNYEAQVMALLASPNDVRPRIDIAWNTNLAFLQADEWSGHRCRPIAMRDTDVGWTTKIVAVAGGSVAALGDLKNRTDLVEGRDYRSLRFDSDVGKHGDTGKSEVEVVRAVLDGRADAGAIGSPFWKTLDSEGLVPGGALTEIWTSPPYNHCMFTARHDLNLAVERQFAEALLGMSYDNPAHRVVLEAEGLKQWVLPQLEGYEALRQGSGRQGFFRRLAAKSANQ